MADSIITLRLVFFGSSKVGKTTIVSQMVKNQLPPKYEATLEDLHTKDYRVGTHTVRLNVLDTAGDLSFPAMRQLSISTATAFVLVYSVTEESSFKEVKQLFYEIKESKVNFAEIPMVIVGNKKDRHNMREVTQDEVEEFISSEGWAAGFLEISALKFPQVLELLQKLVLQWRHPISKELNSMLKFKLKDIKLVDETKNNNLAVSTDSGVKRSQSLYRRTSKKKDKNSGPPTTEHTQHRGGRRQSMEMESIQIGDCSLM
ncbi:ras-related protein Rap-2b-like [Symsagittifera roscoffensis]|uniref:ras-related protein Rap-2b-like n=1 Tax=Symsagittifera roscoffensis TaxID=84072 RepID=UPI00307BDC6F